MKTLVIHPKDSTTDFLSDIYSDKDWTIISDNVSKKTIKDQIKSHDRIVMLEKKCIFIWCNADVFVKKYKLKGFYTGMIVSDYDEAFTYGVYEDYKSIEESNKCFAIAIKESIDKENMLETTKLLYQVDNSIVEFNKKNIYYE